MEYKSKLVINLDAVASVEIIDSGRKYNIKDYIAKTIREIELDKELDEFNKKLDKRANRKCVFKRWAQNRSEG